MAFGNNRLYYFLSFLIIASGAYSEWLVSPTKLLVEKMDNKTFENYGNSMKLLSTDLQTNYDKLNEFYWQAINAGLASAKKMGSTNE
ncbi:MAG: hypothetical protein HQM10_00115 [Candidatus Riflebacteria bacterium]|nr:hypothetical protein [Candidatus Riflebacteria bacterium]